MVAKGLFCVLVPAHVKHADTTLSQNWRGWLVAILIARGHHFVTFKVACSTVTIAFLFCPRSAPPDAYAQVAHASYKGCAYKLRRLHKRRTRTTTCSSAWRGMIRRRRSCRPSSRRRPAMQPTWRSSAGCDPRSNSQHHCFDLLGSSCRRQPAVWPFSKAAQGARPYPL